LHFGRSAASDSEKENATDDPHDLSSGFHEALPCRSLFSMPQRKPHPFIGIKLFLRNPAREPYDSSRQGAYRVKKM
jgi:hypothetical protein